MQRVKQEDTANLAPYSTSASSTAAPTPSDTASPLPTTSSYTDYVLYSGGTGHHDWRYNIMKFAALGDKEIDPSNEQMFIKPVKLNRKDPRTVRRLTDEDRERINKRILERNGNATVKGEGDQDGQLGPDAAEDGKDASGVKKEREMIDLTLVGRGVSGAVPAQAQRHKSGMFKKKIRRVFVSSEEARRLKREEWMPWVLEDDEGNERWIGRLEGGAGESVSAQKSAARSAEADAKGTGMSGWRPEAMQTAEAGGGGSSYVAFVNDPEKEGFQVFPVGRWYRFNQGPKYVTLGTEEAESEVSQHYEHRCEYLEFTSESSHSTNVSKNQLNLSVGSCANGTHQQTHQLLEARLCQLQQYQVRDQRLLLVPCLRPTLLRHRATRRFGRACSTRRCQSTVRQLLDNGRLADPRCARS